MATQLPFAGDERLMRELAPWAPTDREYAELLFHYLVRRAHEYAPVMLASQELLLFFVILDAVAIAEGPVPAQLEVHVVSAQKVEETPLPDDMADVGRFLKQHAAALQEQPQHTLALTLQVFKDDGRVHVIQEFFNPLCGCCRKLATRTCSGCKRERYCCRTCQEREWPIHRMNCARHGARRPGVVPAQ